MTTDEKQPAVIGSLKRFKVAGFRRLVDVDVELGPLNILIGSNGMQLNTNLRLGSFLTTPQIQKLALSQRPKPSKAPEQLNNQNPPSKLLGEVWRTGGRKSKSYNKVLHLPKILNGQDLELASKECPTLKSFLNRLLTLSGAPTL